MTQDAVARARDIQTAEEAKAAERPNWVVPMIIGCAILMLTLEGNIMANALPAIAHALHEEPLRLNIAITMFMLASAVFLPVSGWIADRFGARRVLMACMLLFAASSAACGFSQSLGQLVLARIFQGASAAMIQPVGRLVLLRITPKADLVGALAILSTPILLGPVVGPMLGGFIVTYFNWRWIFFINLPIAVIGVTLMRAYIPDVKESDVPRLDWFGTILMAVGLASFMFGFENLGRSAIPPLALAGLFALSLATLGYYGLVHVKRTANPVIDISLYKLRTFGASTIGGAFMRLGLGGQNLLTAMLFQVGFGMNAFAAGVMTFFSAIAGLFIRFLGPPILRRFGFRRTLFWNSFMVAGTFMLCATFRPDTPHWVMAIVLAAGGFFRFLQFTTMNTLVYAEIEPEKMSQASTSAAMAQQMMLTAGVGFSALMLHTIQQIRGDTHLVWEDVSPAFLIIALVTLVSIPWFLRLPPNAGAELYQAKKVEAPELEEG